MNRKKKKAAFLKSSFKELGQIYALLVSQDLATSFFDNFLVDALDFKLFLKELV